MIWYNITADMLYTVRDRKVVCKDIEDPTWRESGYNLSYSAEEFIGIANFSRHFIIYEDDNISLENK